jgi:thioredoxin reductase (NADPH)
MSTPEQRSAYFDVVVVGAGPAGISAAINVANRKRSVLVLDSQAPFAKTKRAPSIPNYPGFTFTTGEELATAFVAHMERLEIPFSKEKVSKLMPTDDEILVFTDREMYHARAVILAIGVQREAELEGEEELVGRGVSYCANCDGRLFAGKEVAFISYIPDGEEEAAVLYEDMGADVTFLPLYAGTPDLPEGVRVLPRERPDGLRRDDGKIVLDLKAGPLRFDGVFVHKASVAPNDLVEGIEVDDRHIQVGRDMAAGPPGVFAAGDCTGEPYQIAKAVGEGQVAALRAVAFVRDSGKSRTATSEPESAAPSAENAAPSAENAAPPESAAASGESPSSERPAPTEPPALKPKDRENLTRILGERLSGEVRIIYFGQLEAPAGHPVPVCEECREARKLVEEFAGLDERIALELHDLRAEEALAEQLGVTRIPATLVGAPGDPRPRIRFYGVPSGYEFGALLDDVILVSTNAEKLSSAARQALAALDHPVHIEVLTTPTCPKCPDVVKLAHAFAAAGPNVTADMIAANEFPDVARLHNVMSVPQVVVNGSLLTAGRFDEGRLLEAVTAAAVPSGTGA